MRNILLISFVLLLNPLNVFSIEPDEILSDSKLENRARNLSKGIRCLVCQNQSIDDSDSELAKDLRKIIRIKIVEGKKDKEINDFLVEKYGNFILMKPPFYSETFLLWSSPFIIVFIGFIIIFFSLKKTRSEN
jgi:cytochrome c-type biogenesis protein CcmH|tara:strand:- start:1914 stop:2312 length:399 start_codon:yes stop_codon:yes gene_type:complete